MDSRLDIAIRLLEQKKMKEAVKLLEEILMDDPTNSIVLYNLGMCYSELGYYDKSIKTLKQSLKYNPDSSNTLTALGYSYILAGNDEKAEEYLKKAVELDPNNIYALQNLGGFYAKKEKYKKAIEIFKKAEKVHPRYPRILYGLALAYQSAGDLKNADKYFRKLVNRDTKDQFTELAKTGLREIAEAEFKKQGLRPDAVMYCLAALEKFSKMSKSELIPIIAEISTKGESGLDVSNPTHKYKLASLPGEYTGLQLVCYMYVGFKIIAPEKNIGFDLSKEYKAAKRLFAE